jgi:hypothetical protein
MTGQVFTLILLALSLTSCWSNLLYSSTYSEGTLTLAATTWESDTKNGVEIPIGETLEIRVKNARNTFYGDSCSADFDHPFNIEILTRSGNPEERIQIRGRAVGQAKITVACTGTISGEYALCGSSFKDTGSITITITEPKTTTRASSQFSDSSNSRTSF